MKLPVLDATGTEVRQIEVEEGVFGTEPNLAVVHQALVALRANRRQGTASTITRSQHRSSTAKTRKQKGSGNARLGSVSSPLRRGGAVAHGPHPRSYRQAFPKRMRRLAIRSMLSQRLSEGGLIVLDQATFEPKTQAMRQLLQALGVERSAVVVTPGPDGKTQARDSESAAHAFLFRAYAQRGSTTPSRSRDHDGGGGPTGGSAVGWGPNRAASGGDSSGGRLTR